MMQVYLGILAILAGYGVAQGICLILEGREEERRAERIRREHREACGRCSLSGEDLPMAKVIKQ